MSVRINIYSTKVDSIRDIPSGLVQIETTIKCKFYVPISTGEHWILTDYEYQKLKGNYAQQSLGGFMSEQAQVAEEVKAPKAKKAAKKKPAKKAKKKVAKKAKKKAAKKK